MTPYSTGKFIPILQMRKLAWTNQQYCPCLVSFQDQDPGGWMGSSWNSGRYFDLHLPALKPQMTGWNGTVWGTSFDLNPVSYLGTAARNTKSPTHSTFTPKGTPCQGISLSRTTLKRGMINANWTPTMCQTPYRACSCGLFHFLWGGRGGGRGLGRGGGKNQLAPTALYNITWHMYL